MSNIMMCAGFPVDLDSLDTPQPPVWWLSETTSPEELKIPANTERLVKRYCFAISIDDSSHVRTLLHKGVCESLGLDHCDFIPFEDESITKIPKPNEALDIFWRALKCARDKGGRSR